MAAQLTRSFAIIICVVGFLNVGNHSSAQSAGSLVEGYVYDKLTQEVITGANVYLSETTLGDASDGEGYFRIPNVPSGRYELIISYIGYEIMAVEIEVGGGEKLFVEQALTKKMNDLGEVVIVSKPDREWERNLKRFERLFIGTTQNGVKTRIVNPEVLDFQTELSGILHARAEGELHILNLSLGYRIILNLTHFEWNYLTDSGTTLYFSRFVELKPSDETERLRWQTNRRDTYKYSPERFFKALVSGKYNPDYKVTGGKVILASKERTRAYRLFDGSDEIHKYIVSIVFPNNHITVVIDDRNVYGDKKFGYIGYNELRDDVSDELYIDQGGNLQNPLDFTLGGVWKDYRVADKLPLNYIYTKK
jgi:hypothetical protein